MVVLEKMSNWIKQSKKVLTSLIRCDIIIGLSERQRKNEPEVEKTWKKFEKTLDKADWLWYNIQAVHERVSGTKKGTAKKLEKSFQNPLTNASVCDILYRLPTSGVRIRKEPRKKLQKSSKNLLTKASGCDIINKLLTNSKRITKLIENWTTIMCTSLKEAKYKRLRKFFWILRLTAR